MTQKEERAIRRHRRELKRQEKEQKRTEREERCRRREIARNGSLVAEPGYVPLREILSFVYHTVCTRCGTVKKSNEMHSDVLCDMCFYDKEVRKEEGEVKEQGRQSDPGKGIGGVCNNDALGGQLLLI